MIESVNRSKHRPIRVWIPVLCVFLLLLVTTTICTAWMVRRVFLMGMDSDSIMTNKQKAAVIAVAEFPRTARTAIHDLFGKPVNTLLQRTSDVEQTSWIRRFPSLEDSGYLLFSGLYKGDTAASVRLIRISDGQVVGSWRPDWKIVLQKISHTQFGMTTELSNAMAINPVLLDNADIVFSAWGDTVRLAACSAQPRWVLNEPLHHSTALDSDGSSFWSPSAALDGFEGNPYLHNLVQNHSIAKISLDGKLLYRQGIDRIFHDNGLDFLLFTGNAGTDLNTDPIHMNEIRSAPSDTKYWKKGDLLISLRNPNTVLLYRPLENKVIWRQTGPWIHQHSADFVNDHQISVFNNNSVLQIRGSNFNFLTPTSVNEVMIYDFDTHEITQPYRSLLESAQPRTVAEGRARILPDGGLFLEETNNGRILRFSKDKLLWSFVNDYDDKHIGALAWSSYLTADEARKPLAALRALGCLSATSGAAPLSGS